MGRRTKSRFSWAVVPITLILCACQSIDDKRIPAAPVNIVFKTQGEWETYGVNGAASHRRFIKTTNPPEPVNFPYAVSSYTGYGGVLLVTDYYGTPLAYDLSCPYEAKPDIRIRVDAQAGNAVCPVCGSTYDIFEAFGHPTSGPAAQRGYGLARYRVLNPNQPLNYMVVTR